MILWFGGKDGALKQRIDYNEKCIDDALKQVKDFVKRCLLPELLSRCFTSRKIPPDPDVEFNDEQDNDQDDSNSEDDQLIPQDEDNTTDQPTSSSTPDIEEDEDNRLWCYCRQTENYYHMIACDGKDCIIEWFH